MKFYRLLICFGMLMATANIACAQTIAQDAPLTKKFFKKLKKDRVDTILVYAKGCIGCERIFPKDSTTGARYICDAPYGAIDVYFIWKSKATSYIKRFDYCSSFKPIQLNNFPDSILNYYTNNSSLWKEEKHFWKDYKKLSTIEKFGLIPPGPVHYSFQRLYFNGYEFLVKNYYTKTNKNTFPWEEKQREWAASVSSFLKNNHFQWELDDTYKHEGNK
ncbi:hypothetical protein [Mucilaginibacter psychrotolerans]|uniref:Uncharacterized protein n=1 Tax=Mucilaginibacter psychrotolerans TaxID=1524096 RepID=A0A4Y8S3R1_9SPHI|nr:hypothetical protein [Mucilaginibacter psychrotolerans]TFF33599.1 hypothetical protein E2R66_25330 [Mucilaginibacter psychrotolerans]